MHDLDSIFSCNPNIFLDLGSQNPLLFTGLVGLRTGRSKVKNKNPSPQKKWDRLHLQGGSWFSLCTGESGAGLGSIDACNTNRTGRGGTKQCVCQAPGHTPPVGSGRHYTLQYPSNVKFRKPLTREKTEAVKIDPSRPEHMQPAIHRVIRTRENNDLPRRKG